MRNCLIAICLIFTPTTAWADLTEAERAYEEGRWADAATFALETQNARGYAYASWALTAQLMVEPQHFDRRALMLRAVEYAEYAYRLDDEDMLVQRQLAMAIGVRGRFMSGFRAYLQRLPHRGRSLLDDVILADPQDPWALGLMGAWHLEVLRRGGSAGRSTLGASVDAGLALYSQSIALDPANPAPRYFLALGLISLEDRERYDFALEQLQIAIDLEPRDAFEAGIRAEARLFILETEDYRVAAQWAESRLSN
jgi:tetratricopeptide (TPR) repeat protein